MSATPVFAIGTINIANAPEWQQSHAYILGDRVVAGPALTIPSTYTNGSNLYLWAVTTAGTSSGSGNGPQTCGSPAGVGGIPTGSWGGATTATDGSVTWTCLVKVDYVSITGFNVDDSRNWATSTSYPNVAGIINAGHGYAYRDDFGGSDPCTSANSGSGPTGTTFGTGITDNGCIWYYQGELTYSSQANRLPHQLSDGAGNFIIQFAQNVTVQLWWGGNQRTHYMAGQAHEQAPLQIHYHTDYINDAPLECESLSGQSYDCNGPGIPFMVTYIPPPGDRYRDNVTPQTGPLRYDETKGVSIFNNAAPAAYGAADALNIGDSDFIIDGLQIQSTQGHALPTTQANYTFGPTNTNYGWLRRNIIIGAGSDTISTDYAWDIENNVFILNSATAGASVIHAKYQTLLFNNTIICTGGATNSTGYMQGATLGVGYSTPPANNNVFLGCVNPFALQGALATSGNNNATDVSSASNAFTDPVVSWSVTGQLAPGTSLSGLTAANQLVNPTVGGSFDGRVKNTSAGIYGAAATFSFSQSGSQSMAIYSPASPGNDILNTARPISGRYDIGAEMFIPATTNTGGGRFLIR